MSGVVGRDIYRTGTVTITQFNHHLVALHTHCHSQWMPAAEKGAGWWRCTTCAGVEVPRSVDNTVKEMAAGDDGTAQREWVAAWLAEPQARVEVTIKW